MKYTFKTQGRDLETKTVDIVAEEDMLIDPDGFHVAAVRFPAGVEKIRLRNEDPTPEQGIRTITVEHGDDGLQRKIAIHDPWRGRDIVFYVRDRTIIVLGLLMYKGEQYYYRLTYEGV